MKYSYPANVKSSGGQCSREPKVAHLAPIVALNALREVREIASKV